MAQDFGMKVNIKLNTSKSEMNKQIKALEDKISSKVKVGIELKATKADLNKQLKDVIKKTEEKMKIDLKINDSIGYINKQIRELSTKITQALKIKLKIDASGMSVATEKIKKQASNAANAAQQSISTIFKKSDLLGFDSGQLESNIAKKFQALGKNVKANAVTITRGISGEIEKAEVKYVSAYGNMIKETLKWQSVMTKSGQLVKVFGTVQSQQALDTNKAEKATSNLNATVIKLNQSLSNIRSAESGAFEKVFKMDANYVNKIAEIKKGIDSLGVSSNTTTEDVARLKVQLSELSKLSSSIQSSASRVRDAQEKQKAFSQMGIRSVSTVQDVDPKKTLEKSALAEIQRMYKKLGTQVGEVQNKTEKLKNSTLKYKTVSYNVYQGNKVHKLTFALDEATKKVKLLNQETSKASLKDMGGLGKFQSAMTAFPIWMSAATLWMQTINAIRDGIRYIYEMDTALTDLSKVTDMSTEQLNDMRDSAIDLGKEMGKSSVEIAQSFAEIGRVFKDTDDIKEFARIATMASNVTSMTAQEASKNLNVAMISFKKDLKDAGAILDSMNEIQNNYRKKSCGSKILSN